MRRIPAVIGLSVALLAGCGGGGGAPEPVFALSGTIRAASGQLVDSDTGDPQAPATSNDDELHAQQLPGAATVGGWASAATDPQDVYRVTLSAGQVVTLAIAEADPATNDLDLLLYDVNDLTSPVAVSNGVTGAETVTAPAAGAHLVVVQAAGGASSYVLTVGVPPALTPASTLSSAAEFVPGEVVVRFRDSALSPAAAADSLRARASALGMVPLAGAARGRPALLALPADEAGRARALATLGAPPRPAGVFGAAAAADGLAAARLDTLRAVKALRRRADVASADLNYVFHPSAVTPNDEFYPLQWHYPLINLPQAWGVTTGTPATGSVVVAVVDTGVFLAHPDLAGQLVGGYDFISDPARARDGNGIDPDPDDPGDAATGGSSSWHGTHVAGTVAARSNDGVGAAGVAWGAKVMPIRVLGQGGGTSYDIIQGLRYAAGLSNDSGTQPSKAADVVNLSLGCLGCFSQAEQDTYDLLRAAGVVVVAAAGNENSTTPSYPASYAHVISVSAVDMALARARYSNRGPNVDLAAPGGDTGADRDANGYVDGVLSALVDDSVPGLANRKPIWTFYQGTSMAAPHVAGVAALMKAVCPALTPAQLDGLIAAGAITRDLGAPGRDDVYGYGLIDALKAVEAAQGCGAPPPGHLEVTPARLDFGPGVTSQAFTAAWTGASPQAVTGLAADAGAAWLTVGPTPGAPAGSYTAAVDPTGLGAGRHAATITLTLEGGGTVALPVSLLVAAASGAGDAGWLYLLLVDPVPDAEGRFATIAQLSGRGASGTYAWTFQDVKGGKYLLWAGTDSDDDGFICDAGEACGAWPTLGVPTPVTVGAADVGGLDFLVGFEVSLGAASAGPGVPAGGFRRLDAMKRVGGRP